MTLHKLGSMSDTVPKKKRGTRAGHDRERAFAEILRGEGWHVIRSPASKGVADLIAIRPNPDQLGACHVVFWEVKSTAGGPFERFGPADRADMIAAACAAGASVCLCWWPVRAKPVRIPVSEWPASEGQAA